MNIYLLIYLLREDILKGRGKALCSKSYPWALGLVVTGCVSCTRTWEQLLAQGLAALPPAGRQRCGCLELLHC